MPVRFDIFTEGNEADHAMVAQNLSPNDIVTLNAGTYHVVSYFGDINAVVRADLRVEPGQLTEATLYHRSAQVSFKRKGSDDLIWSNDRYVFRESYPIDPDSPDYFDRENEAIREASERFAESMVADLLEGF